MAIGAAFHGIMAHFSSSISPQLFIYIHLLIRWKLLPPLSQSAEFTGQRFIYEIMQKTILLGSTFLASLYLSPQQKTQCCGIVGIASSHPQSNARQPCHLKKFLCDGIELLKNRGYDSAGIFTMPVENVTGQRLVKYADDGCINRVVDEVLSETGLARSGIAHTRWATCGEKVDRNAHPHFDASGNIHIVHNGIISNHQEIRNKYLSEVAFSSQTDTEVIAQFLGMQKAQGKSMLQAMKQFQKIAHKSDQWGLVVIQKNNPETIYTATRGSPLLIGFSADEKEVYVASEKIAFAKQADCYFVSEDGQVFELKAFEIPKIKAVVRHRLHEVSGKDKEYALTKVPQPYIYWYYYQVRQQREILFQPDFSRVKALHFGNYLSMIACGSSYFAAITAEHFFRSLKCFKKLNIKDPAQLHETDIDDDETVVLISQSGETKDLINIVGDCKKKEKVTTIGIINVEGSTLARKVDYPIYIKVGREVCVAATKSFFHQVLNLIQFATEVSEKKQGAPMEVLENIRKELSEVPNLVNQTIIDNETNSKELAEILRYKTSLFLLGKRETMGIARQAALKIKELNYIHAEAMGACEMKHGPIALIESDANKLAENPELRTAVFLFVLDNQDFEVMMNAIDQMHSRQAYVVVITNCKQKIDNHYKKEGEVNPSAASKKYNFIMTVPHLKYISHLLCILPIQLFVEQMCLLRKIIPDTPRNLAKTVTV